ncbi:MAG: tryptophan-rich sensory protein [Bacteroidales bacterium]|nr:MAG: tryptophan-rich sensory protein [Bacteroidales bacterium]
MKKSLILKFVISLLLPLSLGAIAGMFTAQAVPEWYATLNQPSFNPPNWVFGPVWTMLYLILGFSFFLIWKQERSKLRNKAILIFLVQMVLNFGWSFLFFYYHLIGFALFEIIILWASIIGMIVMFYKIKPLAAYLNVPYFLWVTFATILNAGYYFLN